MELLSDEGCSLLLPSSRDCSSPAGRTDRQAMHALGQGRTERKNPNNQPKIDSLLLNLISPNWIHMSWPWHINFNYSLLMSP